MLPSTIQIFLSVGDSQYIRIWSKSLSNLHQLSSTLNVLFGLTLCHSTMSCHFIKMSDNASYEFSNLWQHYCVLSIIVYILIVRYSAITNTSFSKNVCKLEVLFLLSVLCLHNIFLQLNLDIYIYHQRFFPASSLLICF